MGRKRNHHEQLSKGELRKKLLHQIRQQPLAYYQPHDREFAEVSANSYNTVIYVPRSDVTCMDASADAKRLLLSMTNQFQHNVVKSSERQFTVTPVERFLFGAEGATYKYLGLRLFACPWTDTYACIGTIGQSLRQRGIQELQRLYGEDAAPHGCDFDICLVNYMNPSASLIKPRPEPYCNMGDLAVGWHSDQNLEALSTIAVQQLCIDELPEHRPWRIACKIAWDAETPAIALPLHDGDVYYMLQTFNHTHQHAVLAGSAPRFSLTYRRCNAPDGSLAYIRARVDNALAAMRRCEGGEAVSGADVHLIVGVQTEAEVEWIRQFWLQGERHALRNQWWAAQIRQLEADWQLFDHFVTDTLMRPETGVCRLDMNLAFALQQELLARLEQWTVFHTHAERMEFSQLPEQDHPMSTERFDGRVKEHLEQLYCLLSR
eukprot:TRINITY_DN5266_c0_g1_i1.p1 TRINITY_DN5266_c0_g1~~TRINITY_DN5266_c0_g1_i1.p1  ORF type:complete len:433 (-),score=69.70 TRINITY_DN5266_c0_g1_i1:201-1499(-)